MSTVILLALRTVRSADRTRVIGMAAESAFFSLLSLPALLLGLLGTLGHLSAVIGADTIGEIRYWMLNITGAALTSDTVDTVVAPLIDDFLRGAQGSLLSVTFLVSLWSGSRAMNVFIDAITIAYGLGEVRGYFRQRALALLAYLGGLLFALIVLPVLVAGPEIVRSLLPFTTDYLRYAYWPVVCFISLACLVALYTLAVPVRTPLWRHIPGGVLAMVIWLAGSAALRVYLDASFGQVTIYGSLAAPIAVLAWLYVTAFAVLIGSVLNAELDALWPMPTTASARARLAAEREVRARRLVRRHERALASVSEDEDAGKDGEPPSAPPPRPPEKPDEPEPAVEGSVDAGPSPLTPGHRVAAAPPPPGSPPHSPPE